MKLCFQITAVCLILAFTAKKADAYLDPGSGSFIFQIIIAALFGGLVALKTYFKKIKLFLINFLAKKDKNNDQPKQ